jgi:hypothetical protein
MYLHLMYVHLLSKAGLSSCPYVSKTYFSLVRWKLESIVLPRTFSKMGATT